jgi:hypothetical protein
MHRAHGQCSRELQLAFYSTGQSQRRRIYGKNEPFCS